MQIEISNQRISVENAACKVDGWSCRCGERVPFGEEVLKHTEITGHSTHIDFYYIRCAHKLGYLW